MTTLVDYRYIDLPAVGDLVDLLPEAVVEVWRHRNEIRLAANEAASRVARCQAAIADAERRDAEDLGAALRDGSADPGPAHATEARAALADAIRQAEGYEHAVISTGRDLDAALRAADLRPVVRDLEARATAAVELVRASLDTARRSRDEFRLLRELACWAAHYPSAPPAAFNDEVAWRTARHQIDLDLELIEIASSHKGQP